jgi:hypothetical protein
MHLNGHDLNVVWCALWRVDATGALKNALTQSTNDHSNSFSSRLCSSLRIKT